MAPGRPPPEEDDDLPAVPEEPFDAPLDLDLDDETEETDEGEFTLPEVPFDEPPALGEDEEPDGSPLEPLKDAFDEEDTDAWAILREDLTPPAPRPVGDRVVLPWQVRAEIPALGIELPAVLDPTRPGSVWTLPTAPEEDRLALLLRLPGIELRVEVALEGGAEPGLVLGRDALAGRILVES